MYIREDTAPPTPYSAAKSTAEQAPPPAAQNEDDSFHPFGKDGFSFLDLIDIINPLQHIPVVSSIYRELTGDTLDPAPRVAGGALFGGPFGAAAAVVNVMVEDATGKDVGGNVMASLEDMGLFGDDDDAPVAVAESGQPNAAETETTTWAEASLRYPEVTMEVLPDLTPKLTAAAAAPAMGGAYGGSKALGPTPGDQLAAVLPPNPPPIAPISIDPSAWASAAIMDFQRAGHQLETTGAQAQPPPGQVAGATAPGGGWFTDTMLDALQKYRESSEVAALQPSKVTLEQ